MILEATPKLPYAFLESLWKRGTFLFCKPFQSFLRFFQTKLARTRSTCNVDTYFLVLLHVKTQTRKHHDVMMVLRLASLLPWEKVIAFSRLDEVL